MSDTATKTRNRTIALPIAEVIEGGTKTEFYNALRESLSLSAATFNLALTECVRIDAEIFADGKMPPKAKMQGLAYQSLAKLEAWNGRKSEMNCISRAAVTKYAQMRFQIKVGRASLPVQRSWPFPLIHNGKANRLFKLSLDSQGNIIAKVNLAGGSKWVVRLAGGSQHRYKLNSLRKVAAEGCDHMYGDSKLWMDRKGRAVVGVSTKLPGIESTRQLKGTLKVSTSRDALLTASRENDQTPFVITGDQCRQWIAASKDRQQRLRCDSKSGGKRCALKHVRQRCSKKQQRRMQNFLHEVSRQVVEHAQRRSVEVIEFNSTIKSYMPSFPYFDLKTKLQYKCEDAGIRFLETTMSVAEPDLSKPHVYFKYSPATNRVKIGLTRKKDGSRHEMPTDSPDRELVILAIDNQPLSKLAKKEKEYHALFAEHVISHTESGRKVKSEWFNGLPVIEFLREVQWLGNAGNLSQVMQHIVE